LGNLTLLKAEPPLKLIELLSPVWEKAADLLGMNPDRINIIKKDHSGSVEDCCRVLMTCWIDNVQGVHRYPCTWKGMCNLLSDMEKSTVAKQLQEFLSKNSWNIFVIFNSNHAENCTRHH